MKDFLACTGVSQNLKQNVLTIFFISINQIYYAKCLSSFSMSQSHQCPQDGVLSLGPSFESGPPQPLFPQQPTPPH